MFEGYSSAAVTTLSPVAPGKPLGDQADAVRRAADEGDLVGIGADQPRRVAAQHAELPLPARPVDHAVLLLVLGPGAEGIAGAPGQGGDRRMVEVRPVRGDGKLGLAQRVPVHGDSTLSDRTPKSVAC